MNFRILVPLVAVYLWPNLAAAQSVQQYLVDIGSFVNTTIIPLLFAIAFVFFIWNAIRYFVIESGNDDARENARILALYGIAGFVIIISIWGIVNLLANSFGFSSEQIPCPDYINPGSGPCIALPSAPPQFTPNSGTSGGTKVPASNTGSGSSNVNNDASWQDGVITTLADSITNPSCEDFISSSIRFYLSDPSLSQLNHLQFANAFAKAGLISNPNLDLLLAVYNRETNAGLLPSGIPELTSTEQNIVDKLSAMKSHQSFVVAEIDDHLSFIASNNTASAIFCDLFTQSKTSSTRPANPDITNDLWNAIASRYDTYQTLRQQIGDLQ